MIPEFQNGSGVPELSPEWFRNPEPFWNVPKYVLFPLLKCQMWCKMRHEIIRTLCDTH